MQFHSLPLQKFLGEVTRESRVLVACYILSETITFNKCFVNIIKKTTDGYQTIKVILQIPINSSE